MPHYNARVTRPRWPCSRTPPDARSASVETMAVTRLCIYTPPVCTSAERTQWSILILDPRSPSWLRWGTAPLMLKSVRQVCRPLQAGAPFLDLCTTTAGPGPVSYTHLRAHETD